jgi:hypothetical protein
VFIVHRALAPTTVRVEYGIRSVGCIWHARGPYQLWLLIAGAGIKPGYIKAGVAKRLAQVVGKLQVAALGGW